MPTGPSQPPRAATPTAPARDRVAPPATPRPRARSSTASRGVISNLIVDQTAGNPAAVEAAGENLRSTPSGAFFIPNVAPDVGLSAPYNSWFTLFGQFFDHGLDLVNKGGNGRSSCRSSRTTRCSTTARTSPTNWTRPLLTRATHDGDHEANNQTSSFVDQSQTYTSHPSHQVFLRAYADDAAGDPSQRAA